MSELRDNTDEDTSQTSSKILELANVCEAETTNKKNVLLWAFYDAADTIFAMAIISITLYQWGELAGMKAGFSYNNAHLLVSTFLMISNILVAILMPIFGTHADLIGRRKPMVIIFASLVIISVPFIVILGEYANYLLGLLLFSIINIFYQAGNLYYESMLPYICETKSRARVSAFGVAFGYSGTIIAALMVFVLPKIFSDATKADDVISGLVQPQNIELNFVFWMFIFTSIFFLLMGIPFLWVKESARPESEKDKFGKLVRSSFVQLGRTIKEIIQTNKDMLIFMLGWFLISDAIGTATAILVDYLREGLGFDPDISGIILFVGIIIGVSFLYLVGPLIDKKGPKFGLIVTAVTWGFGILISVLAGIHEKARFLAYIGSAVLAFGMGSVWVTGRQYILELSPTNKIGQYMGFKKISGKVSAALGPVIYSSVLKVAQQGLAKTAAYQIAIISLLFFFIIGFIVTLFVKNYHPQYLTGQRYPYIDNTVIEQEKEKV
ncbi:MAG: MFS transporter [Asgard group archaeon]|nr:MFS transporter [Asgard group archaeon]